ncbi:unnamed protein product, partial [Didymodactylos carnosus]
DNKLNEEDKEEDGEEYRLMSINEIMNGSEQFAGLIPLMRQYLYHLETIDTDTRSTIEQYLNLISKRARGTLMTDAKWIRQYVDQHPKYEHDSIVTDEIQYDLLWKIQQITNDNEICCPTLIQKQMLDSTKTTLHLPDYADIVPEPV